MPFEGDDMKHKLKVCIKTDGKTEEVFRGRHMRMPRRLLNLIFGECCQILVLKPGDTIKGIEVHEVGGGDEN